MMIRLIREDLLVASHVADADGMTTRNGRRYWVAGTQIDVDKRSCQLLVGNGDAEPVDEESEACCVGWQNKRAEVLLSREMLAKGIEPEDRERFRNGEILGYDEDGNDIPGPNYCEEDDCE